MNKNTIGVLIILVALGLFGFYGWPRIKPYISDPAPAPATSAPADTSHRLN
jgi:hypothetical protein